MRIGAILFLTLSTLAFVTSCKNSDNTSPVLPSGCSNSGVYAISVVRSDLTCLPTNAFTNADEVLGPPNAGTTGDGKTQYRGFLSLGIDGSVVVYMGSCIQDLAGPDIRVFQSVSREAVEVQVAQDVDGPFVSLGFKDCVDSPPFFTGFCDFDLAGSGLSGIRVVKIIDREVTTFPGAACDNAGLSPGADIDAIQVLNPVQ